MTNSLVIGASGFIGRRLCARLAAAGVAVHGTARQAVNLPGVAAVHVLDITDAAAVARVLSAASFDTIYHLAAVTEHHRLVGDPIGCLDAYVSASVTIAKAFLQCPAGRLVYSSTGKVYGPVHGRAITEADPVAPTNVLGRVKALAEDTLRFACSQQSGKSLVLARIFNVYGPGQKPSFLVPTILNQLRVAPRVELGNLTDGRDYIYIDDLIGALEFLGRGPIRSPVDIFNVGSGSVRTVHDILHEIQSLTGRPIEVGQRRDKLRADESSTECADIAKLRSTGWSSQTVFRTGLAECIRHYSPELLT